MLSVPWLVGWALRPYIQINSSGGSTPTSAAADTTSSAAKAQVAKLSSAPVPTTVSKPYPVTTQPITSKGSNQVQSQPAQQVTVTRSTATKTAAAPPTTTPLVAKQAAPVQGKPAQQGGDGPEKQVSSTTITLKMSAEWATQQLEKFKFSFDEADRDKSGFLSLDEVIEVLKKNGFKGSKDDAKQLFAHLDVNKDQKLTRDEFAAALSKLPRVTIKEFVLRKAFKQLDKDGSGTLSKAEIEAASKKEAGLDIAAEKIADLLAALKQDKKDDVVDYEEFLRVFGVQAEATVMHQIFSKLDEDKSGFLTKEEIMKALDSESELKLRAAKISDLLIAWHKDADKKINYNEFVQVWIKYK